MTSLSREIVIDDVKQEFYKFDLFNFMNCASTESLSIDQISDLIINFIIISLYWAQLRHI